MIWQRKNNKLNEPRVQAALFNMSKMSNKPTEQQLNLFNGSYNMITQVR